MRYSEEIARLTEMINVKDQLIKELRTQITIYQAIVINQSLLIDLLKEKVNSK